jgi:malate dehydrogenase (quinone)
MAQMYQSGRYCKAPIKVYGKASVGAPPMSVPHIDSRMINGENSCYLALLVFNPILKNGSYSDLPLSIKPDNIFPMLSAGIKNIPLTKYLIQQVRQSPKDRMMLKEYVPSAKSKDWIMKEPVNVSRL